MPGPNFFAKLGLFVVEDFFDREICGRLQSEMQAATHECAAVVDGSSKVERVKHASRRTGDATVSATTSSLVQSHLRSLQPQLESHFHIQLSDCEKPQFLIYKPGDFFRPHRDGDDDEAKPEYINKRRVSLVIFLNNPSEEHRPETYSGGSLTLYGVVNNPSWRNYGFQLTGTAGLLIAFRSDLFHEVSEVVAGERYTVVSWFLS
jgi:SM-20-related protein